MRREQIPIIRPPKKPIRINGPHSGQTFCLPASQPPAPLAGHWIQLQPPSHGKLKQGNSIAVAITPEVMQLTPRLREKGRMIREVGTQVCDWWFGVKCVRKCVYRKVYVGILCYVCETVRVYFHQHKPVCSTENRTRQQIPAASVADKLQGLAGTSGAQVALSIQDRAH